MHISGRVATKSDRELADLRKVGGTNTTVTQVDQVLASFTVPAGETWEVIETRFGGDTDNRVALRIGGQVQETYYHGGNSKGKDLITTPQLFRGTGGQVIEMVSRVATSGNHSAMLILRKA